MGHEADDVTPALRPSSTEQMVLTRELESRLERAKVMLARSSGSPPLGLEDLIFDMTEKLDAWNAKTD